MERKQIKINGKVVKRITINGGTFYESSILPSGYKLCDYLQSDGNQYIDTEYYPNYLTTLQVTLQADSSNNFSIGEINGSSGGRGSFCILRDYFCYDYIMALSTAIEGSDILNLTLDKNVLYVNGELKGTLTRYTRNWTSPRPFTMFALNRGNGVYTKQTMKIYSLTLLENGVIVRDYKPALDADNIPCMYDLVTKKAYYNLGSGSFTYKLAA